jgi:type VI secretion system protein ImpA
MSVPDLSRFLTPISEEQPAGEWLRFDAVYDDIKILREQDDPTLPQGVWKRELKRADWPGVARLAEATLESRSKDLQIAAWMTEAWIHLHGFRGFERGFCVIAALCRNFWDSLYPLIDDGEVAPRLAPIAWVSDKLVLPLKSVPLTAAAGEQTMSYGWRDWESALYFAKSAKPAATIPDSVVTQSKFMVAVSLTPAAHFVTLETELSAAVAAVDALEQALREKLGDAATPSLTTLRTPLVAMQQFVTRVRAERGEPAESTPVAVDAAPGEEPVMSTSATPELPPMTGAISNRAEAYHRLREASDYLMRAEPHSPVPYLVRRAISWGNLSLAELLEELLQKNTDLATINALLGIRKS